MLFIYFVLKEGKLSLKKEFHVLVGVSGDATD